ncbi:hypothetical protein D3C83_182930 [compost metagenome]
MHPVEVIDEHHHAAVTARHRPISDQRGELIAKMQQQGRHIGGQAVLRQAGGFATGFLQS